jgi:peptidoglycan/LPS O-acetylase OafA/YrhL
MTQAVSPGTDFRVSLGRSDALHQRFLDSLRGYAILGVVIAHLCYAYEVRLPRFLDFLGNGVTLFYVLSAYCLMLSLCRGSQPPAWKQYALRRFFRIAPAFYVAVALWTVAQLWAGSPPSRGCVVASLSFVNGWIPPYVHSAVPHGWSIGVEMSFYAVLPVLYALVRDVRTAVALFLIDTPLCVAASWGFPLVVKWLGGPSAADALGSYTMFWPISQFPVFVVGIIAYLVAHSEHGLGLQVRSGISRHPRAIAAALVSTCLGAGYLSGRLDHVAYAGAFGVLVVAMACGRYSALDTRVASALGTISFGVYLFHQAAINLAKTIVPRLQGPVDVAVVLCLAGGGATMLGALSYCCVERPGIAVGRALSDSAAGIGRRGRP